MAEKKKKKALRERLERRFLPEATHTSRFSVLLGMTASGLLGGGVYGQWVKEIPFESAPVVVTLGAVGLGFALWLGNASAFPVRVGDSGVAIERGSEVTRLLWCDIEELKIERGDLVVKAPSLSLTIPLGAHPMASAHIVAQAEKRLPKILRIDEAGRRALPRVDETDGQEVPVASDQVAGRRCAATKKIISFERDARLCPTCAQVYFKDNVPKTCVTCGEEVAGRANPA